MKRVICALALSAAAWGAQAQGRTVAKPGATSVPVAYASRYAPADPAQLRDAAMRVAAAMDEGKIAEMWANASKSMQAKFKKKDFVKQVGEMRKKLGPAAGRSWIVIHREISTGGNLPAGQYASVEFELALSGSAAVKEVVSFTLDADGMWRLVGYTIR
ncbi:peptidase [Lysobacter antibioticus]|uniref:DUF4019 domain-containing protein n=1 Tax=Lysobacter antibioticus TaxID=84531 RepID=UPI0007210C0D|nr:DUF4019 domain-containing protein [Lysobacter antibioticus]ALN61276.1 peptidase [Lysobacter antibioticus]